MEIEGAFVSSVSAPGEQSVGDHSGLFDDDRSSNETHLATDVERFSEQNPISPLLPKLTKPPELNLPHKICSSVGGLYKFFIFDFLGGIPL